MPKHSENHWLSSCLPTPTFSQLRHIFSPLKRMKARWERPRGSLWTLECSMNGKMSAKEAPIFYEVDLCLNFKNKSELIIFLIINKKGNKENIKKKKQGNNNSSNKMLGLHFQPNTDQRSWGQDLGSPGWYLGWFWIQDMTGSLRPAGMKGLSWRSGVG